MKKVTFCGGDNFYYKKANELQMMIFIINYLAF